MLDFDFCPVEMLPMDRLELDPRFNREVVPSTIKAIDNQPDPDKFGVLSVASMNGHGMYSIYDGGNRFSWLQQSGYTGRVPCSVGRVSDPHQVAIKFVEMQHDRRDVSPWERYRKFLFAEVPENVAIDRAVKSVGWRVGPKAVEYQVIPTAMHQLYRRGEEEAVASTVTLARDLWDGRAQSTNGNLLIGLHGVIAELGANLDRARFVERLAGHEPSDLLVRARIRRASERGTIATNVKREILKAYRARPREAAA